MEWILGGCLAVLILIWSALSSAVTVLKNVERSIELTRFDLSKEAREIINELVVIGGDISSAAKKIDALAGKYAPPEADLDRFEREFVIRK